MGRTTKEGYYGFYSLLFLTSRKHLFISQPNRTMMMSNSNPNNSITMNLAFLGNSMLYYNDCPRMVQQMLAASSSNPVVQDSCLRGGCTLSSLWHEGNGMMTKFASSESIIPIDSPWGTEMHGKLFDTGAPSPSVLLSRDTNHQYYRIRSAEKLPFWDYCIINDYTQSPAREESRRVTSSALKEHSW